MVELLSERVVWAVLFLVGVVLLPGRKPAAKYTLRYENALPRVLRTEFTIVVYE